MALILRDLKESCLYEPGYTYSCTNCGGIIKYHVAKRFFFEYGGGGTLCMTCLYKLHLELTDVFEQSPMLITEVIKQYY